MPYVYWLSGITSIRIVSSYWGNCILRLTSTYLKYRTINTPVLSTQITSFRSWTSSCNCLTKLSAIVVICAPVSYEGICGDTIYLCPSLIGRAYQPCDQVQIMIIGGSHWFAGGRVWLDVGLFSVGGLGLKWANFLLLVGLGLWLILWCVLLTILILTILNYSHLVIATSLTAIPISITSSSPGLGIPLPWPTYIQHSRLYILRSMHLPHLWRPSSVIQPPARFGTYLQSWGHFPLVPHRGHFSSHLPLPISKPCSSLRSWAGFMRPVMS